ncbi:MAG: DUF4436 family protein [Leptospiraceae bacterium]|nr:DUF4436 family protein [Leptospiraceae bacterium]
MIESIKKKKTLVNIGIGILFLIIFGVSYAKVLRVFEAETEQREVEFSEAEDLETESVDIQIRLNTFDALKGDLFLRVNPDYRGTLVGIDNTLARSLRLYLKNSQGRQEFELKAGTGKLEPVLVVTQIDSGLSIHYPFDEYKASLKAYVYDPEIWKNQKKETYVPITVEFKSFITEFEVESKRINAEENQRVLELEFTIRRTKTAKFFSIFVMSAIGLITLVMLSVLYSVIINKRKAEMGTFAFMSAMIFALPALRNSQPGVPPIGALCDYLVFFWAEGTAAICLIVLVTVWFFRKPEEKDIYQPIPKEKELEGKQTNT